MDPSKLEWIKDIDWLANFISTLCIITMMVTIYEVYDKISTRFGFSTKKQREDIEYKNTVKKNTKDIEVLEDKLGEVNKNLTALNPVLNNLNDNINTVIAKQDEQELKNRETKKAEYKDRLYQAYRFYKNRAKLEGKKEWTSIESDGFWTIFHDYESYGGNGHAHDEVEPFMREFTIDDNR